ncbi:MAG: VWA domain-containing protein [Acidobacteria bacterium]|nr:VWA domain-containing protein [Acidobacteriota bacterium]
MRAAWLNTLAALAVVTAVSMTVVAQKPTLQITWPLPNSIVIGATLLEAAIDPPVAVESVTFSVNGRLVCTVERLPFRCAWDPGAVVRGHHVRVVATLADGSRLIDNVRTKDLGHVEKSRVDAVLVPVIVTDGSQFVRGLKMQDFEIVEDGVTQSIAALVTEDEPLDLVLAIDISGSMEPALGDVKAAVKQLLAKLRPGDTATLVGFNDTMFIAAEREKDRQAREEAVDLLASWGGTALYDATVRVLDLVSREWGRKGLVIFSDGDDRNSLTTRENAMARVQATDAMLYTIGFGGGATTPLLRSSLENYARSTGGRPFFPRDARDLDGVFDEIVSELANQYVLSYSPTNLKQDSTYRNIKVHVRKGTYDIRARRGYRLPPPQRAGSAMR